MARDAEFYLQKAGEFEAAGDAEKAQVMRNAANSFTNPEPERFPAVMCLSASITASLLIANSCPLKPRASISPEEETSPAT